MDPKLCTSLSKAQTTAMALTALSACVDALLARELALGAGPPPPNEDVLLNLGSRGIGAVAEGLPVALADGNNVLARELLTMGSVCAGQLSAITPAPPIQVQRRLLLLVIKSSATGMVSCAATAVFALGGGVHGVVRGSSRVTIGCEKRGQFSTAVSAPCNICGRRLV